MILNLTQHPATQEQLDAGVINLTGPDLLSVKELLTFSSIPTAEELNQRAHDIAAIAADCASPEDREDNKGFALKAMIGGAPFFMGALESALVDAGLQPVYAFSVRQSGERTTEDGTVIKTNVFKHIGFVEK